MRRFVPQPRALLALTGLCLAGCAAMPQVQVSMPGSRAPVYRGPSMGSAVIPAYTPPSMGGAGAAGYPQQTANDAPQMRGSASFTQIPYSDFSDNEPAYRFYPGDQLTITNPGDPSLNGDYMVGPDGRISMLYVPAIMASGRTADELKGDLRGAYRSAGMLNPTFNVQVKTASAVTVYVGGEVNTPGEYPITGDANALQAIVKAGSFKSTARANQVVILRRGPNGQIQQTQVNLSAKGAPGRDLVPLRRGDIVFVPKTTIAEVGTWVTQMRDALPIQFGYTLNGY